MNNAMKKYILFLIYLFLLVTCYGQTRSIIDLNKLASVPVPSPNVAALNKFVEFPVNHFNGQMDVSFPLYEIKLKNVSVPITLKYHTGGIRVDEEASWVGLGWALDAGGVISHQVRGLNDLIYGIKAYYGQYFPTTNQSDNESYNESILSRTISGTWNLPNASGQQVNIMKNFYEDGSSQIDGDPDVFLYNFGTYSGKFIKWNAQRIDLNCNNIVFTQYIGHVHTADSIVATTPEGVIYKFKEIEASFSMTGTSGPEQNTRMNTSAYYLTEIIAPNGEKVKFSYKTMKQLITDNRWKSNFPTYANGNSTEQAGYYPSVPSLFEECHVAKRVNFNIGEIQPNIEVI